MCICCSDTLLKHVASCVVQSHEVQVCGRCQQVPASKQPGIAAGHATAGRPAPSWPATPPAGRPRPSQPATTQVASRPQPGSRSQPCRSWLQVHRRWLQHRRSWWQPHSSWSQPRSSWPRPHHSWCQPRHSWVTAGSCPAQMRANRRVAAAGKSLSRIC